MKIFSYLTYILCILQLSACKKFLDKKTINTLVVPSTLTDLRALLQDTEIMNRTPAYPEISSGDYFIPETIFSQLYREGQNQYLWKNPLFDGTSEWRISYQPIYNTNLVLELLDKIPVTASNEAEWNSIKGAALFFRAYHFHQLALIYANSFEESKAETDPGIIMKFSSDFNVPSRRSNMAASYQQIIKDAKSAESLLQEIAPVVTFPSKVACYGLLSRTYLSMRKYDSAFKYANLSLQIKGQLMDYNDAGEVDLQAMKPFRKFNREIVLYTAMNYYFFPDVNARTLTDTTLFDSYHINDLRKQAFFIPESAYQKFKGSYAEGNVFFTGIATDELFLTRSECYARMNQVALAMDDLNAVLKKRWKASSFTPVTAGSAEAALATILIERRKELLFRGLRWMDAKRLNKENANITFKRIIRGEEFILPPNNDKWALAMPIDILQITGIPQNPGWN